MDKHILTLEDPVEYIYTPKRCVINQREIGRDTKSFAVGLRAALREDPYVILVGEMRDLDTIETALTAAETGHLVFGTVHTNSAADSIDRIVDVFPAGRQQQIRVQLSQTLKAVLSQQLLPKKSGGGRVAACEVMKTDGAIRNLIREGKTHQIQNSIQTTGSIGNILMERTLQNLLSNGTISRETYKEAVQEPVQKKDSAAAAKEYTENRFRF
jgi:twitching motility protein PilT